jgi:hypothetical protein
VAFGHCREYGKVKVVGMRHLRCLWFPVPTTLDEFLLAEGEVLFVAMWPGIVALTDDFIPCILTSWPSDFVKVRKN